MFFLLLSRTLQEVASSFYLFLVFLSTCFSAAPVIRWYACELLGNLNRKLCKPDQKKKFETGKVLISLEASKLWMSCVYEWCITDSPYLTRYLLEFTFRKLRGDVLKFLKGGGFFKQISLFNNTLTKWTLVVIIVKSTLS